MQTLVIILSVIVLALLAVVARLAYQDYHDRRQTQASIEREQAVRRRVAEKTAVPITLETELSEELRAELSHSGSLSIQEEIDRCVTEGLWDDAIKWSHHAIDAAPDEREFQVKLAEIYGWSGDREAFTVLFEELHGNLDEDNSLRAKLRNVALGIIPDHALLQD